MDKNEIEIRLKDGTWIEVDRKENDRVCIMNKTGDGEILTGKIWEENELILELLGKYDELGRWFRLYQEEKMKHLTFFDEIVKKCGYKAAWEVEEEAEKRATKRDAKFSMFTKVFEMKIGERKYLQITEEEGKIKLEVYNGKTEETEQEIKVKAEDLVKQCALAKFERDSIAEELKRDASVKLYGSGHSDNYLIPVSRAIEIVKNGGRE